MSAIERTETVVPTPSQRAVREPGVRDALRGEFGMLGRRLGVWMPIAVWAVCVIVFAHLVAYASTAGAAWYTAEQQAVMIDAMSPAGLAFYPLTSLPGYGAPQFILLGALYGATDHARGTLRVVASRFRRRQPIIVARSAVIVGIGGVISVVTLIASSVGASIVAAMSGAPAVFPSVDRLVVAALVTWTVALCFLMIGFAIGTVVRSVIASVAIAVVWVLGVETLLLGALAQAVPAIAELRGWLPVGATTSLAASVAPDGLITMPPLVASTDGGVAAAVLLGWTLVAATVAAVALHRRDLG